MIKGNNDRCRCRWITYKNSIAYLFNYPFNKLIENGHIYLAQPPLFKVTKANKSIYIKDEKALEEYILNAGQLNKKIKGSPNIKNLYKSKKNYQYNVSKV